MGTRRKRASRCRIKGVKKFATDKRALDYLAGRIAAEAEREGSALSEVERKMLYFSETDWTLPEMAEVSAEFDRVYDQNEYERKIAGLIGKVTASFQGADSDEQENWDAALERLSEGDRFLPVMVDASRSTNHSLAGGGFLPTLDRPVTRPPHDFLKLLVSAAAILGVVLGVVLFMYWLDETKNPAAVWISGHGSVITYLLIVVAALVFSFWKFLRSAIQVWRDGRQVAK